MDTTDKIILNDILIIITTIGIAVLLVTVPSLWADIIGLLATIGVCVWFMYVQKLKFIEAHEMDRLEQKQKHPRSYHLRKH